MESFVFIIILQAINIDKWTGFDTDLSISLMCLFWVRPCLQGVGDPGLVG